MKPLFQTLDYSEALVIKARLEQAGFFVHMDNFNFGLSMPEGVMGVPYRIWVADSDVEEAIDLLKSSKEKAAQPAD